MTMEEGPITNQVPEQTKSDAEREAEAAALRAATEAAETAAQAAEAAVKAAVASKMAADTEALARIRARLVEVVPNVENCSFCGSNAGYSLNVGVVQLKVNDFKSSTLSSPTLSYPTAILVCQTCGNTVLLNLFVLGLPELTGLKQSAEGSPRLTFTPKDS